eukprot:m.23948 g.23948  ORF g.23948 m.23948 type:complete len:363 (+) comp8547_c1_seq1:250-1338(+)
MRICGHTLHWWLSWCCGFSRLSKMGVVDSLLKHWFLVGLVASIGFAKLAPWVGVKNGPLHPEWTVKYGAVSLIFFNSGLTLKTEELKNAVMQFKLHAMIQLFTLAFVPVLMWVLVEFFRSIELFPTPLLTGLSVLSCMPPPVSSAVILTAAAGGNEAGAIFNSAFGSFLGIFVTPLLLLFVVGESAGVPLEKIFLSLTLTVVLPLVAGQLVRKQFWNQINDLNIPFSKISSFVLLVIIYTTFCDTFTGSVDIEPSSLAMLVVFLVMLLLIEMIGLFFVTRKLNFAPRDVVCVLFCATHKSLTLGIPMMNIVFANSTHLSLLSVPLLVYHPTQIFLGSVLVPTVKGWLDRQLRLLPTHQPQST